MSEPVMAFVGNWESLAFRRRRPQWAQNEIEDLYEAEHTPEIIAKLKDIGVNYVLTHFFKGFGLVAGADEVAKTAQFIADAHAAGIGVGTYISSNIFYETFLDEEPDAGEWIGINYDGSKTIYFDQYFRWQMCYCNPAYVKYITKTIDKAVEIGADLIHLDNFNWMPNYDYCHCPHCVAAFRRFLDEQLSPQQRKKLLGFSQTHHVTPPPGIDRVRLDGQVIPDPLMRLWIAFRAEALGSVFKTFCDHARSKKPDIKMEFNGEGLACIYNHIKMGVDFDRMLPDAYAFWGEDGFGPQVHPNGCIGGRWRSMKMAETYGSHFFGYTFNSNGADETGVKTNRLYFAEHLAFNNNCAADVGNFHARSHVPSFQTRGPELKLLRENEDLFASAKTASQVACFRNFPSQAYCGITTQIVPYNIEQMLFVRSVPFDILMDSHLGRLGDYKLVFLAGTLCMNEAQRKAFADYAAGGGSLILIGEAGKYDEWGLQVARSFASQCGLKVADGNEPVSGQVGKGMVHYRPPQLPQVVADAIEAGDFPNYADDWAYYPSKLWAEPADADQIAAIVNDATGGPAITHDGPPTLICQLRTKAQDKKTLLHLLQYQATEPIETVTVKLKDLAGSVESVTRVDFDNPKPRPVQFTADGSDLVILVRDLNVYSLLIAT